MTTYALDVIQPHETWGVQDSTKLGMYMECPRKYFFEYVLGWRSTWPINHLEFGTAWHLACEALANGEYTQEAYDKACSVFLTHYRKHFSADTDDLFIPKDPANAIQALAAYASRFQSDVTRFRTLQTEVAGMVLIAPGMTMHFKLDWIGQSKTTGNYLYIDQKTSQRYAQDWGDHWVLSTQMLLYLHALYCLFPKDRIEGGIVRCSFFYDQSPTGKTGRKRTPTANATEEMFIRRSPDQMAAFLARTERWYKNLTHDFALLEHDRVDDAVMEAFPQNDKACYSYGRMCLYHPYCAAWSNPLQHLDRMPAEMKVEFWDPREQEGIHENLGILENAH